MRRKWFLLLMLLTLFGSLLGCGQSARPAQTAPMARYMPPETTLFLSLQLRPEEEVVQNWRRIRDAFAEIPMIKERLDEMAVEARENIPFDWKLDVEPWLGATMALGIVDLGPWWDALPQMAPPGHGTEDEPESEGEHAGGELPPPPFLAAIEVQDRPALDEFLDDLGIELSRAGFTLEESTSEGTTIYTFSQAEEEVAISYAVHEDRALLVSNDRGLIEEALGREEADALTADEEFRSLVGRLPPGGLALGYAAYERMLEGMRAAVAEVEEVSLPETWGGGVRAAGFTVLVEPEGLRLESAANLDLTALAEAGLKEFFEEMSIPLPGRAQEFLPKESALALAGQNLRGYWELLEEQLQQVQPEAYEDIQGTLEDLAVETGLDIEADVLSWLSGEYTLFLAPGEESAGRTGLGLPAFRGGFLLEVTDREKAEQAMEKVEALVVAQLAQMDLPVSFYPREIEGVEARVLPALETLGYLPGYAFVDDFLLVAIDEPSFRAAILAGEDKGERLASSADFRPIMEALPEDPSSLFFLDVDAVAAFLDGFLLEPQQEQFRNQMKPFLDLINGLGVAAAAGDDYITGTVFVQVK